MASDRSARWRIFLTCWLVFSLHFATNIVREHYPAFAMIDHCTFRLDEYAGFHSDIFEHRDGHHYIGNQVTGSVIAAVPLLVFKPVLDSLEERGRARAAANPPKDDEYDTKYPMRRAFFKKVRERGLDLKFGAAAAITSVFLMAPLSALLVLLVFGALERRGVPRPRATWLALLFAFATPVLYRSAYLNHNLFLTLAAFGSFLCIWRSDGGSYPLTAARRFWAGFLAAMCLALDYAGLIPMMFLFGYLLVTHRGPGGWRDSLRAAPAFVAGTLAPVAFLLWSQWAMYGDPFKPGQAWMPNQNQFVQVGARGFTAPDAGLFLRNLFDLDWGMYAFGPLLLVALVPARRYPEAGLVLPRRERVFTALFLTAFMVFCACNQYSRLQWNTGFRYLLPLVPFAFLEASDHLARMRTGVLAAITVPVVLHTWVLTMVRYTPPERGDPEAVPESWRRFLTEGVQFPWLNVLRSTPSIDVPLLRAWYLPYLLLAALAGLIWLVWRRPRGDGAGSAPA